MTRAGYGPSAIAAALGMARTTVSSYLCRKPAQPREGTRVCAGCGGELPADAATTRLTCSDACRWRLWKARRMADPASWETCPQCGEKFAAIGGAKYCCHACYVRARFSTKGGRR